MDQKSIEFEVKRLNDSKRKGGDDFRSGFNDVNALNNSERSLNNCQMQKDKVHYNMKLSWLSENYIFKFGLRNWTWKVIIDGIIIEHVKFLSKNKDIDDEKIYHVKLIWYSFLHVQGITDFSKVPVTRDPNHVEVKSVLLMYSLQSFLYPRLNSISRDQD